MKLFSLNRSYSLLSAVALSALMAAPSALADEPSPSPSFLKRTGINLGVKADILNQSVNHSAGTQLGGSVVFEGNTLRSRQKDIIDHKKEREELAERKAPRREDYSSDWEFQMAQRNFFRYKQLVESEERGIVRDGEFGLELGFISDGIRGESGRAFQLGFKLDQRMGSKSEAGWGFETAQRGHFYFGKESSSLMEGNLISVGAGYLGPRTHFAVLADGLNYVRDPITGATGFSHGLKGKAQIRASDRLTLDAEASVGLVHSLNNKIETRLPTGFATTEGTPIETVITQSMKQKENSPGVSVNAKLGAQYYVGPCRRVGECFYVKATGEYSGLVGQMKNTITVNTPQYSDEQSASPYGSTLSVEGQPVNVNSHAVRGDVAIGVAF